MKDVLIKKWQWHFSAFLVSLGIVLALVLCSPLISKALLDPSSEQFSKKYSTFISHPYYPVFQSDNNEALHVLRYTLESGDVALFGSSELSSDKSRFTPYLFLSQNLKLKLKAFGHAGCQNKAIITEILSVYSSDILEHGRIVILLSPTWFLNGEGINESLWRKEIATPVILSRIRENKMIEPSVKDEILGKEKSPFFMNEIDKLARIIIDQKFLHSNSSMIKEKEVLSVDIKWEEFKNEAKQFEKNLTTNSFAINDEYYGKYIKPIMGTPKFPLSVAPVIEIDQNKEIKDFELLLRILSKFKNPPLFVILPLSQKAYKDTEMLNPTLKYVESKIHEDGYPLLNLWSRPFEAGVLTDVMHVGAYGWTMIDEFIYKNSLR